MGRRCSESHLLRFDDGRNRVVKFANNMQGLATLENEILVSRLAEFLRVSSPRGTIVDRQQIKTVIVQSFARWKIDPSSYLERVEVLGYTRRRAFDYGLRNGNIRTAIYAISFQMAVREDIVLHRDHVAWAAHDIHQRQSEFPILAVTSPPLGQTRSLCDESLKMLMSENVGVVPYEKFDNLRSRLVPTLFGGPASQSLEIENGLAFRDTRHSFGTELCSSQPNKIITCGRAAS